MKDPLSSTAITMEDKQERSTPDVPKSNNTCKGKCRKAQHKKKSKGGKTTVTPVVLYTSSAEELKQHIFTTGPTMNKAFLKSREKFLGCATTKFGNNVTFSLDERIVALVHTPSPTSIDHT